VQLRSLLPVAGTLSAEETVEAVPWPADGPWLAVNMVSSLDGRATRDGRSGGLSSPADQAIFHALRARADAVMVGAGTARAERYGAIVRDPAVRAAREAPGQRPPLAVVASHSLRIDPALPLLADRGSRVVVLTSSDEELPASAATVSYIRGGSLAEQLGELRQSYGVRTILCEGGPTLNGTLFAGGLVDELLLSLTPLMLGGAEPLTILSGPPATTELELVQLTEHEGQLYMRYRVRR
jgi:riboflavin-specific deaminase-like protein